MLAYKLQINIGYIPEIEKFKDGPANTAFVTHSKKTYALSEQSYPFTINIPKNHNEFDIQSKGYENFEDQLTHNVSAHPKVDKKKEELITFGYDLFGENGSFLKYSLFNKDNKMINYLDIPIRGPIMIHDIAITGTNVIFNDLPL
jgi:carotenoid cleavage dioxygenase-like enzyme